MVCRTLNIREDARSLTPSQGKAVGYYLWGEDLDGVRIMWKYDFHQLMINHLLVQPLSHRQIADLMNSVGFRTRNGWPFDPDAVKQALRDAALKFGTSSKEYLRERALKGLEASIIRVEMLRDQDRYSRPRMTDEDRTFLDKRMEEAGLAEVGLVA
jgi:hypothetical protein